MKDPNAVALGKKRAEQIKKETPDFYSKIAQKRWADYKAQNKAKKTTP